MRLQEHCFFCIAFHVVIAPKNYQSSLPPHCSHYLHFSHDFSGGCLFRPYTRSNLVFVDPNGFRLQEGKTPRVYASEKGKLTEFEAAVKKGLAQRGA